MRPREDSPDSPLPPQAKLLGRALAALDAADLRYCLRNGDLGAFAAGEDIDALIRHRDLVGVRKALQQCGWHHLAAPGHDGHEFWLALAEEGWVKLDLVWVRRYGTREEAVDEVIARRERHGDIWVACPDDEERHHAERAAGQREVARVREKVRRQLPLSLRRCGVVVAVMGPDGAGKGTMIETTSKELPVAVTVSYLGDRRASARDARRKRTGEPTVADNHDRAGGAGTRRGTEARLYREASLPATAKEVAFLVLRWGKQQPTVARSYWRAWTGHVVLLDRHPLDAVAVQPNRTRIGAGLERILATVLTPAPDALVVLDAPGAVLFERKGEHDPKTLERWRQGYRSLPGATILDSTAGVEATAATVRAVVWRALAQRRRWTQ